MVSSSLTLLQQAPAEQADIANTLITEAVKVRLDQMASLQAKVQRLSALADSADSDLTSLQDRCNKAEAAVRQAAAPANTLGDAVVMARVEQIWKAQPDLASVCQVLVNTNDVAGFAELRQVVQRTTPVNQRVELKESLSLIDSSSAQLLDDAGRQAVAELREVNNNIGWLRQNFQALFHFCEVVQTQTFVSGMVQPVEALAGWATIAPNGTFSYAPKIALTDGLANMNPMNQFVKAAPGITKPYDVTSYTNETGFTQF